MPTVAISRRYALNPAVLDDIRAAFGLSVAEAAVLFAVSRPALQQWRTKGIPVTRAADVDRIHELAQVFLRKFAAVRIPQIVRTNGKGLGGRSVLEVLAERGVEPIYAYLERLFSYADL